MLLENRVFHVVSDQVLAYMSTCEETSGVSQKTGKEWTGLKATFRVLKAPISEDIDKEFSTLLFANRIVEFASALGIEVARGTHPFDERQLLDRVVTLKLSTREYQSQSTGKEGINNNIESILPEDDYVEMPLPGSFGDLQTDGVLFGEHPF